jgi:hypothetical protein
MLTSMRSSARTTADGEPAAVPGRPGRQIRRRSFTAAMARRGNRLTQGRSTPLSDGGAMGGGVGRILRRPAARHLHQRPEPRPRQPRPARTTGRPCARDGRLPRSLGRWKASRSMDPIQDGLALAFRRDPATARAPGRASPRSSSVLAALEDILQAFPEGPVAIVSHGLALAAPGVCSRELGPSGNANLRTPPSGLQAPRITPISGGRRHGMEGEGPQS